MLFLQGLYPFIIDMVVHLLLMFHLIFNWKIERHFPWMLASAELAPTSGVGPVHREASDLPVDILVEGDSWMRSDYNCQHDAGSENSRGESSRGGYVGLALEACRAVDAGSSADLDSNDCPSAATTARLQGGQKANEIVEEVRFFFFTDRNCFFVIVVLKLKT